MRSRPKMKVPQLLREPQRSFKGGAEPIGAQHEAIPHGELEEPIGEAPSQEGYKASDAAHAGKIGHDGCEAAKIRHGALTDF